MAVGHLDVMATPDGDGTWLHVEKLNTDETLDWVLTHDESRYLANELLGALDKAEQEAQ